MQEQDPSENRLRNGKHRTVGFILTLTVHVLYLRNILCLRYAYFLFIFAVLFPLVLNSKLGYLAILLFCIIAKHFNLLQIEQASAVY